MDRGINNRQKAFSWAHALVKPILGLKTDKALATRPRNKKNPISTTVEPKNVKPNLLFYQHSPFGASRVGPRLLL